MDKGDNKNRTRRLTPLKKKKKKPNKQTKKQTKKEKKRKKTPRLRCEPKIFGIFSAFHVLL